MFGEFEFSTISPAGGGSIAHSIYQDGIRYLSTMDRREYKVLHFTYIIMKVDVDTGMPRWTRWRRTSSRTDIRL